MVTQTNSGNKYKILLVEDDSNIALLFSFNFKKAGFECEVANNGIVGLQKAKEYLPDLIISDIMMPEMDGFAFRKKLLVEENLKSIPFIFLTAKSEEEDILEGYNLDIEDYIVKTAGTKVILAKINAILKTKQKERKKAVAEVHQAADKMGAQVVPDSAPNFDGYNLQHWHVPYQDIPGGDFIDYFKVDDSRMLVVLGDVMGKKWGAWYFAVAYAGYVRSAIRFVLESDKDFLPKDILTKVNQAIYKDERLSEVFITLSLVLIDRKNDVIYYSGAGDLPILVKSIHGINPIQSNGLLLGFNDASDYEDKKITLEPGDEIFVFTDGIIESRNTDGEQFEQKGLMNAIKESGTDNSLTYLKNSFIKYTNNNFEDDLSIIWIQKK